MLGSRRCARVTSSSTLMCPGSEKKASTITSRWRVGLRPRSAIQLASCLRAASTARVFLCAIRFILKLILNFVRKTSARVRQKQHPQRQHPPRSREDREVFLGFLRGPPPSQAGHPPNKPSRPSRLRGGSKPLTCLQFGPP